MKHTDDKTNRINNLRIQIVSLLSAHDFVSGAEIAQQLSITRSSVSNHVRALNTLGLDIFSVKGRGYRLAKQVELLNQQHIENTLVDFGFDQRAPILVENIVDSTNDVIKRKSLELPQGSLCLAEAQTSGRGRRGRKWISPFGASIYLTMLWRFDSGYQSMAGLSLMVGLAVNRALLKVGLADCQLKWPNDIYHKHKKLAGILIEVEGQVTEMTTAIIGIGVNFRLPDNVDIDQAFTDIHSGLNEETSRNYFVACLIESLWTMLPQFQEHGLTPFLSEWAERDLYVGTSVSLVSGNFVTKGISRGIDASGALLLESEGQVKPYHGGEISVRPI
ncbi:bifunctional biotin--[acetyl-CoA-carboxylase] ligase/biotin operon repressor BirA [Glaciecola sp. XM2]|jgi:BirA family biotin operon repressor/biotin-[acetyl-CoA-carboxylase] ligase|uniref:bifunctional biotin--[acetyl-CoA-carboxylase] ligase/biotin operon repressor BirA n=1 Tax=Glaciecola sp. XM2 TaxID=1914931 RepID=UPI001BDE15CE|nr:bifunctional biotin--[acetyl-CoA-carboxylase] ligase/biotin operon repressor BirA [Glaciecola sp. XM2]MBT1451215.1 bifunctional biotin--[acetyl-CoA-carboxylase] ligase/biotin operon repressor BirA [Glaciecola sp. XM2]